MAALGNATDDIFRTVVKIRPLLGSPTSEHWALDTLDELVEINKRLYKIYRRIRSQYAVLQVSESDDGLWSDPSEEIEGKLKIRCDYLFKHVDSQMKIMKITNSSMGEVRSIEIVLTGSANLSISSSAKGHVHNSIDLPARKLGALDSSKSPPTRKMDAFCNSSGKEANRESPQQVPKSKGSQKQKLNDCTTPSSVPSAITTPFLKVKFKHKKKPTARKRDCDKKVSETLATDSKCRVESGVDCDIVSLDCDFAEPRQSSQAVASSTRWVSCGEEYKIAVEQISQLHFATWWPSCLLATVNGLLIADQCDRFVKSVPSRFLAEQMQVEASYSKALYSTSGFVNALCRLRQPSENILALLLDGYRLLLLDVNSCAVLHTFFLPADAIAKRTDNFSLLQMPTGELLVVPFGNSTVISFDVPKTTTVTKVEPKLIPIGSKAEIRTLANSVANWVATFQDNTAWLVTLGSEKVQLTWELEISSDINWNPDSCLAAPRNIYCVGDSVSRCFYLFSAQTNRECPQYVMQLPLDLSVSSIVTADLSSSDDDSVDFSIVLFDSRDANLRYLRVAKLNQ